MKNYTDLEQSKKLAEILPLESADYNYSYQKRDVFTSYEIDLVPYNKVKNLVGKFIIDDIQPAWSLAALLGVLPEIQGGKPIIALDDNYITYPHMSDLHTKADNLVDACVAMIIKLSELKML